MLGRRIKYSNLVVFDITRLESGREYANRCTADTVKICENRLKTPKMQTAAIIHKKTYIMIKKRKKKLTPTYKTPQKKLTIEQYEPL